MCGWLSCTAHRWLECSVSVVGLGFIGVVGSRIRPRGGLRLAETNWDLRVLKVFSKRQIILITTSYLNQYTLSSRFLPGIV